MHAIATVGLDIAKSAFHVHGIEEHGNIVVRQQLKRARVLPFINKLAPCRRNRGVCVLTLLVARAASARTHRAADATGLCPAVCQTATP